MIYEEILTAVFIERPNRFYARAEMAGQLVDCHVKNTSRLRELLLPGAPVALQRAKNPLRKTRYDLISVEHNGRWVNIDSSAPNRVFGEWILQSGHFGAPTLVKPESRYANSRFDYYIEVGERKIFAEVKGVTLVEDGIARFPGAPTLRGVKHLEELGLCMEEGFEAVAAFIIARDDVRGFAPNDAMQPAFGRALRVAAARGVRLLALDCRVGPGLIEAGRFVDIIL